MTTGEKGLLVLLAEDDPICARFAMRAVTKLGHEVVHVGTGREVLRTIGTRPFDVLLLDLGLPELDGLSVAHALKNRPERGHATIIALTASDLDEETRVSAGIDAVLDKPFDPAKLAELLRRNAAAPAPKPSIIPSALPQDVLNIHELRARTAGDDALIAELFGDFLRKGKGWAEDIAAAAARGSFSESAALAHRLRGGLNALGARRGGGIATEIEACAAGLKDGSSGGSGHTTLAERLGALLQAVDETSAAMRLHLDTARAA